MRYLMPSIIGVVIIVVAMFNTASVSEFDIEEDWYMLIPLAITLLYLLYQILFSYEVINSVQEDNENQNSDKVEEKKEDSEK